MNLIICVVAFGVGYWLGQRYVAGVASVKAPKNKKTGFIKHGNKK